MKDSTNQISNVHGHQLTVLIVDDEIKITEVLKAYLDKYGYDTAVAYDGCNALEKARSIRPDLIILDLMLPDMKGEEVCSIIHEELDIPIIMLTAKIEENDMIKGLQYGADDYIVKPFSPRNVLARVEAVLRRTQRKSAEDNPDKLEIGKDYIKVDFMYRKVTRQGQEVHLTPSEYKIFELMTKAPNRIFSREQIITYALNGEFDGYDRSIDTYIKSIRQKLEPDSKTPRYFVTVYGVGYKFIP